MKKIKTSISLLPDTHARLTEQAVSEHRTISNMVESVIEKIFGIRSGEKIKTAVPDQYGDNAGAPHPAGEGK